jgi:SAM-dependent methyltransferase
MRSRVPNAWDSIFRSEGRVFAQPHEDMPAFLQLLRERGARRLLDVGSGSGRHSVYFARQGLAVCGIDRAPEGIRLTREWLAAEGLTAQLCLLDLYRGLPYQDAAFDALISVQVLHHAVRAEIEGLVAEMARVLRPGGVVFVSVPKLRNQGYTYHELEPDTWVPLDGREAGVPHHYFTPETLRAAFRQFAVRDIHLDNVQHYCLVAEKQ